MPSQPNAQPAWNTSPQQYGGPPKKSSKTWIWVLLILGLVVILCGGGLIGLFAYIATHSEPTTVANSSTNSNKLFPGNRNVPSNTASNSSTEVRDDAQQVDLSVLVNAYSIYGDTEFSGGELTMSSKQKGYYYVVVATNGGYDTDGANTRVTIRNKDNVGTNIGYGLVFHSNPTPLTQDYAFLLDTVKKRYRLVRHQPGTETAVVPWTNSSAIKDGGQDNILEVRDHPADGKFDLYVNGQLINTVPNKFGFKDGIPGLYAGDAVKVIFKDLEILK